MENPLSRYQKYKNSIIASVTKHYQAHREEKNAYHREYIRKKYNEDDAYRERVKERALARYYKKKEAKVAESLT